MELIRFNNISRSNQHMTTLLTEMKSQLHRAVIGSIAQLCHIYPLFRESDSDFQKRDTVLVASGLIASNIKAQKSSCLLQ